MFIWIKNLFLLIFIAILLFGSSEIALGVIEDKDLSLEQLKNIDLAIKKINKDLNVQNCKVSFIPNLGLYKIISVQETEVFYLSKDHRYFFYGELIDLHNPNRNIRNITEASKMFIRRSELQKYPINKMIVFKPKRSWLKKPIGVVTIFTDLDCPYANRLHQEVTKTINSGLEVRYLLFPRAGIGSESYKKAVSVWCAKDHNKAFSKANNGENVVFVSCKNNPIEKQFNLARKIGVNGTPSIILKDGRMIVGYLNHDSLLNLVKEDNAYSGSR